MKLAVLTRHFSPDAGGAEHYSVKLVEQLAHVHEIHVFAQHIHHEWPGVTYHTISSPFKRPRWLNQWWFSYQTRQATQHGFDLVHSHENTSHGHVHSVHVIPLWINYFGLGELGSRSKKMSNWRRGIKGFLALLSPRLLSYLLLEFMRLRPAPHKLVLAVSGALSDELGRFFHLDALHLKTLIPGVESSETWALRAHTNELEVELAKSLLQLTSNPNGEQPWLQAQDLMSTSLKRQAQKGLGLDAKSNQWLLWVGHDERKKGLFALLQAMLELPASVGLMLVGKGGTSEQASRWIASSGLGERVVSLGVMRDIVPAIVACDVMVHPTLEDTFGMAVAEAMAWARSVVVSPAKYCGLAREVQHQHHVLVLNDPRDSRDIAFNVLQALANGSDLGANALAWTRVHGWADQATRLDCFYRELVSTQGGSS